MTTLCRFYRIAHHTSGLGPYQHFAKNRNDSSLEALNRMYEEHQKDITNHPCLRNDTYKPFNKCPLNNKLFSTDFKKVVYGFRTLAQLRNWFTENDLKMMHKHGFNLEIYETTREYMLVFDKQAVLTKPDIRSIWKQNLISLVGVQC